MLARRSTSGIISGEILIDGHAQPQSPCRRIAYIAKEDVHMSTMTVRESLRFSQLLRKSSSSDSQDKLVDIDQIIHRIGLGAYADTVVGAHGRGNAFEFS